MPLRIRVSMSEIGSVMTPTYNNPLYQLALTTPGISPRCASGRKQIRHRPNFRNTARGRPQRRQREYLRTLNLGVRFHFSSIDFLATVNPLTNLGSWMETLTSSPRSSIQHRQFTLPRLPLPEGAAPAAAAVPWLPHLSAPW